MSLEQGLRYESSSFGFPHHQFIAPDNYGRQFPGTYMDNTINGLYNQVQDHDNQRYQMPPSDFSSGGLTDSGFGSAGTGQTIQSLLESFGKFDLGQNNDSCWSAQSPMYQNVQNIQTPSNSSWPILPVQADQPADSSPSNCWPSEDKSHENCWPGASGVMTENMSPLKFSSQMLKQNPRSSPFSDHDSGLFSKEESSSLFSSRRDLSQSHFSSFSTSSLVSQSMSQSSGLVSSQSSSKAENSLGLSDISTRLEELSQGSLIMSRSSTRDSTPLSWNPIMNYPSSKTNSLTASPVMSGVIPKPLPRANNFQDAPFTSDEDEDSLGGLRKNSREMFNQMGGDKISPQRNLVPSVFNANKPKLHKSMSTSCMPDNSSLSNSGKTTSWSQIVRTSSAKLPSLPAMPSLPSPPRSRPVTRSMCSSSPVKEIEEEDEGEAKLVVEDVPPTTNTVDYHRGPKVDQRWPVSHQVFLGPIPMTITWDEIRNVFYTKVQRRELLHFYVQSKPVNEVVYGQVVFDRPALAAKVVKEGPVKVRGHLINVTLMKEKVKHENKKK